VKQVAPCHSGENHQKDDQLDHDERRDDEEDCEQVLIDELHVRQVVARIAIPLHFPAKGEKTPIRPIPLMDR
jgi:hypothetical protein